MGALAPNIFYYRVIDMHPLARGLNLLCILGLRLAVGINSSFLAQLGCRAVRCIAAGRALARSDLALVRQRRTTVNFTMVSGLH